VTSQGTCISRYQRLCTLEKPTE